MGPQRMAQAVKLQRKGEQVAPDIEVRLLAVASLVVQTEAAMKELAQRMFEAYNASGPNPNKTWDGKDVPPWSEVGPQVTAKWRAAATAACTPPAEKNLLITTLEELGKEPSFGHQTERLAQALAYAVLQNEALAAVSMNLSDVTKESARLYREKDELEAFIVKARANTIEGGERFNFEAFADECHGNSVAHGWHDKDKTFGDYIALMHSELSEALEAFREPGDFHHRLFHFYPDEGGQPKPEGVLSELADVVIRILDYTGAIKAQAQFLTTLKLKHEYNKSRPYRHGGKQL